jgi:hypothetical protein
LTTLAAARLRRVKTVEDVYVTVTGRVGIAPSRTVGETVN